tara:strand:+ start:2190 stop:2405 length:216 start_codon:yes stop_codon:yes gene_type:complete
MREEQRYAETWWTIEDVKVRTDMSDDEAHTILAEIEESLCDAMNNVGSEILDNAIDTHEDKLNEGGDEDAE